MSSRSPHLVVSNVSSQTQDVSSRIVRRVLKLNLYNQGKKSVNEIMMESKAGNKKSKSSLFYEAPLGYSIEDVRPFGGIKKFKSSVYSNCAKRPS
ncbi:unnamed protein product [Brassica oleracea]